MVRSPRLAVVAALVTSLLAAPAARAGGRPDRRGAQRGEVARYALDQWGAPPAARPSGDRSDRKRGGAHRAKKLRASRARVPLPGVDVAALWSSRPRVRARAPRLHDLRAIDPRHAGRRVALVGTVVGSVALLAVAIFATGGEIGRVVTEGLGATAGLIGGAIATVFIARAVGNQARRDIKNAQARVRNAAAPDDPEAR